MNGHWMPIYWADYFADTTHLTTEEHGAYLLMIGAYWRRGTALPDDPAFLASVCKLTVRRFKVVSNKLSDLFVIFDAFWYHVRVEKELLKSSERLLSARANGRAGGLANGLAKSKLLTSTLTEERKIVDLKDFVVGKVKGEMSDANKIALFQKWLAELIGRDGWAIVGKAADPGCPEYETAIAFCKKFARQNGKGWPHQWPKPQ